MQKAKEVPEGLLISLTGRGITLVTDPFEIAVHLASKQRKENLEMAAAADAKKVKKELETLTGLKVKAFESTEEYLAEMVECVGAMDDEDYEELSEPAKKWAQAAIEASNAGEDIPDYEDVSYEEDEDDDEVDDEDKEESEGDEEDDDEEDDTKDDEDDDEVDDEDKEESEGDEEDDDEEDDDDEDKDDEEDDEDDDEDKDEEEEEEKVSKKSKKSKKAPAKAKPTKRSKEATVAKKSKKSAVKEEKPKKKGKKEKASKKKKGGGKRGANRILAQVFAKNPSIKAEAAVEKCAKAGFTITEGRAKSGLKRLGIAYEALKEAGRIK